MILQDDTNDDDVTDPLETAAELAGAMFDPFQQATVLALIDIAETLRAILVKD